MPQVHRFAEFVNDLQQLERGSLAAQGTLILDAFTRHTPFEIGALYLRDTRESELRLAAKSELCVAPEILGPAESGIEPRPHVILPLRSQREQLGMLALTKTGLDAPTDDDLAFVRVAAVFLSTMMTNQRLLQEMREGDFQLKYRLWELESLYDIGLSIASTLNIDELADEILFRMISLTNARRAGLFLRQGERFTLYRTFGDIDLDEESVTRAASGGEPVTISGGTVIGVPIKGNNAVIGILAAADRETRDGVGAFEANELRLLSLFANQVAIALENARLHRDALEKQSMERELELAATIQRDILPKSIPEVAGIELATLSRPAKQVGGDYHAFFERDGVLTMLVADVSGKSMPAALLVSALHAATHLLVAEGRDLAEIATELNRHLHSWSAENKFVTMVMVSIDRDHETIRYVNAGHNPTYLMFGDRFELMKSHGLPIGILSGTRYMAQTRPFPSGSTVVLYSDGITEAEDVAGNEFDNPRLEEILRQHAASPAATLRDAIAEAVDTFTKGAPQKDDQTIVIARSA